VRRFLSTGQRPLRTRQHHSDQQQKLWRLGLDLRRSDHCHRHSRSPASSLDDHQHSRRELSTERPAPRRIAFATRGATTGNGCGGECGRRYQQSRQADPFVMSFLRHKQIYQSDVSCWEWQSEADCRFALPLIVLMSLRPAIPRRVALLHCSLPLHRTILMMKRLAGNCKPPLSRGWGIFSWRFGEFSLGVDTGVEGIGKGEEVGRPFRRQPSNRNRYRRKEWRQKSGSFSRHGSLSKPDRPH
jgi:hypothetical protein